MNNRRLAWLILGAVSLSPVIFAQTKPNNEILGKVYEINSGNKPVFAAQVSASGANSKTTDSKGVFDLSFDQIPPGRTVMISLSYGDWRVINDKERVTKIPDDRLDTISYFMCSQKVIDEKRASYYNISVASVAKTYKARLNALDPTRKDFAARKKNIDEEYASLTQQLFSYAESYATKNYDRASVLEKRSLDFFLQGNLPKAIALLEQGKPIQGMKIARNTMDQAQKVVDAQRKLFLLHLEESKSLAGYYLLHFDYAKAKEVYLAIATYDPDSFGSVYHYAMFLNDQNDTQEALTWLERSRPLVKDSVQMMIYYQLKGELHQQIPNDTSYLANYRAAESLSHYVLLIDPYYYQPRMVSIERHLAENYLSRQEFPIAKRYYFQALQRCQKQNDPAFADLEYQLLLGISQYYACQYRADSALYWANSALQFQAKTPISKEQSALDPADAYSQLGLIAILKNDYKTNEHYARLVLDAHLKSAVKNPKSFQLDLPSDYYSLGNSLFRQGYYKKAKPYLLSSLKWFDRLKTAHRLNQPELLGTVYGLLANIADELKTPDQKFYEEKYLAAGVKAYREDTIRHAQLYGKLLTNYAITCYRRSDYALAIRYFQTAIGIFERMNRDQQGIYNSLLNISHCFLGKCYIELGRDSDALPHLLLAASLSDQLLKDDFSAFADDADLAYNELANYYSVNQSFEKSTAYYMKDLNIANHQSTKDPSEYMTVYDGLGWLQQQQHKLDSAIFYYQQVVTYAAGSVDPDIVFHLGKAYCNLAECYTEQQNREHANTSLEHAQSSFQRLSANDPEFETLPARINAVRGDIALQDKSYKTAKNYYRLALAVYTRHKEKNASPIRRINEKLKTIPVQ
ncbi:tetratricopeptide repeat protein [Mucilaginibacter flavidus]|uniref:tetratricopeptide repeat protein n=1 Tax=Mucilaginibacter flavidus TaxID=2949309 RepID=UPI002093438E|nr:tetratricopeptide repeat protein [Mucilaginibacter flavidus]MCO5948090.1 tetratricopeptide repeat protein [Mucilaginibacter flavidus]